MTTRVLLDTSVVVPLLVQTHEDHATAVRALGRRQPVLAGHSLAESYSVLTRLPGSARIAPADAVRLLDESFPAVVLVDSESQTAIHRILAGLGIRGGAVYDGLVALAAVQHELPVLSRDARAQGTYRSLGAELA